MRKIALNTTLSTAIYACDPNVGEAPTNSEDLLVVPEADVQDTADLPCHPAVSKPAGWVKWVKSLDLVKFQLPCYG